MAAKSMEIRMLEELLGEDDVPKRRGRPPKADLAAMSDEERIAHRTEQQRQRRARIAARESEQKTVIRTADSVRQALADAALMILSEGGDGAARVMRCLEQVFDVQVGVPLSIRAEVENRTLSPKYLSYAPLTPEQRVRRFKHLASI